MNGRADASLGLSRAQADVAAPPTPRRLKVILHAVGLAKYRVPVYADFADRGAIDLTVYFSQMPGLNNVEPRGFTAKEVELRTVSSRPVLFHQPSRLASVRRGPEMPDVIIMPWDLRYLTLVPTMLRARANGVGVVLWGHGYSKNDNAMKLAMRQRVADMADCIVLYHRSAIPSLVKGGIDQTRIFVAPNAIDQTPIQQTRWEWVQRADRLARFKAEHGLESGPVLLFVARLMRERRVDVLLNAMSRLAQRYPTMQAVLIGGGPEELVLREQAKKLGIVEVDRRGTPVGGVWSPGQARVRFLGAMYEENELAPWFLSSDAMVFPAHLGLSVLHAFGYGLPVITSDQPSLHGPEFSALRNEENGKLFKAHDAVDLAESIEWLIGDPQRLHTISDAALRTAIDDHNVPRMVDGLHQAVQFAYQRAQSRR